MNFRNIAAILPFALLAACGGSSSSEEAPPSAIETASPEAASSTEAAAPAEGVAAATEAPAAEETTAPVASASPTASATPAAETAPAPTPVAATPVAAAKPPAAFAVCRACHAVEPGQNRVGPTLHGIYGSKAGDVPGYNFSPALAKSGIVWDRAALDTWLKSPMKMVPGTKMVIAVPDAAKREAIIDYLETLK